MAILNADLISKEDRMNPHSSKDSAHTLDRLEDQDQNLSWWEWCSDPRVEASILALSALVALITRGLLDR